jgi:hypothetical protein
MYSSCRPDMVNRYPRSPSCFHAVIKPAWYAAISAARSVGGLSTGAGTGETTTFVRFRVMIGTPRQVATLRRIGGVSARAAQPARDKLGPRVVAEDGPGWVALCVHSVGCCGRRDQSLETAPSAHGTSDLDRALRSAQVGVKDLDPMVLVYYCDHTAQRAHRVPSSGDSSSPRFELSRGRRPVLAKSVTRRGG